MYGSSFAILLHAFALAFGDRLIGYTPEESLKQLVPDFATICGEPEIWRKLTENPTVQGVQNINWLKIDKTIEDSIASQSTAIAKLELEIAGLEKIIADKKAGEEARIMTEEDVTNLITDGLASFATKDTEVDALEVAKQSRCGKPGKGPAPKGAYRASMKLFEKEAGKFFEQKVRCNADFVDLCLGMVVLEEDREDPEIAYASYCPQLCQRFKDIAQELSDSIAGELAGAPSDEYVKQQNEKIDELKEAEAELRSCQQARSFIISFGEEISEQKKVVDDRFGDYRDAEERFYDADESLADLQELLEGEEAKLEEAEKALAESGADVSAVEGKLDALKDEISGLLAELKKTSAAMDAAGAKLHAAKGADYAVVGLKNAVSLTAIKMRMLFEKSVLDPLTRIGIGAKKSLDKLSKEALQNLDASKALDRQLTTLAGYCQGEGKEAFEAVKKEVDLDGLCDFKPKDEIMKELHGVVLSWWGMVDTDIKQIQTWFDPLKGQNGMTPEKVQEYVARGEPQGIREIVGVFQNTDLFRGYLKQWLLKGTFPSLIADLEQVVLSTDSAFQQLQKDVAGINAKIAATEENRKAASDALEAAVVQHDLNAEAKEKLQETVNTLSSQGEELLEERSQLEKDLQDALKEWEEAKAKLLETHKQATSFVELHEQPFDVMKVAVAQARHKLAVLERELAEAEAEVAATD